MTIYEEDYEERPRHRKLAPAKKPKNKKADHKHIYKDCAVTYVGEDIYGKRFTLYSLAKYCEICGKLECNWFKHIDRDQINKSLRVFDVEMYDKKVQL